MTVNQLHKLIELLQELAVKPVLFTGDAHNPYSVMHFLYGMRWSLIILGLDESKYRKIVHTHGWKFEPVGLVYEMQEAGISDKQIIKNLIDLEIDLYKTLELDLDYDAQSL